VSPNPDIEKQIVSIREDLETFSGRRGLIYLNIMRFNAFALVSPLQQEYYVAPQPT
jgi:hypothetical protein